MPENLLVDSWEELKTQFKENSLRNNRTIKVGLLLNTKLSKDEFLKKLQKKKLHPKIINDLIRINVPLSKMDSNKVTNLKTLPAILLNQIDNEDLIQQVAKDEQKKRQKEEKKRILHLKNNNFMCYLYFLDNERIIFISTNESQKIQTHFISPFVNQIVGLSLLWLSYQLMADLVEFLKTPKNINGIITKLDLTSISTIYIKTFQKKSLIRPELDKRYEISSEDVENSYYELKKSHGVYPRRIEGIFDEIGKITINKEKSTISFSHFEPELLIETIIPWIYNKALIYLSKIMNFKISEITDPITQIKTALSNYLIFDYNSGNNFDIKDVIEKIQENSQYKVLSKYEEDEDECDLILGEPKSRAIFNVFLSSNRMSFTLNNGDSYDAIFPLLNLLDNHGELVLVNGV